MTRAPVRIGVVGLGWWSSRAHIPAIVKHPGAELVGIVDRNDARRRLATELYDVPAWAELDDLLARNAADALVIATPPSSHFALATRAIDAGLHVLVEKPMVLDPTEGSALSRAAAEGARHVVVGYAWHFNRQVGRAREWIAEQRIGRLQYVATTFASVVRDLYAGRPELLEDELGYPVVPPSSRSYSDPAVAGGGQAQTQLTHSIALLLHMTGLEPLELFAFMSNDGLEVDVIDALSLRFASGCLGVVGATGASVPGQPEFLDYRLYGERGHIHFDVNAGVLALHDDTGHVEVDSSVEGSYPEDAPVNHLIDLIHGVAAENLASASSAATVVDVLAAAYRSAAEHRQVHLSEVTSWNA